MGFQPSFCGLESSVRRGGQMKCPGCGNTDSFKNTKAWKGYSFYLCPACDIVFCDPIKNPGRDWYESSDIHLAIGKLLTDQIYWYHKEFLSKDLRAGSTLLDVGCGTGNFLNAAQKKYDVWGIDFNRESINIARERHGLKNVSAKSIEELTSENKDKKFDIITSFEVFEHQEAPGALIGKLKDLLAPRGYLALSVPNRDTFFNPLHDADMPPNHLTWWNVRSMKSFLERNGFEVVSVYPRYINSDTLADFIELTVRFGIGKFLLKGFMRASTGSSGPKAVGLIDKVLRASLKPLDIILKRFKIPGVNLFALARLK